MVVRLKTILAVFNLLFALVFMSAVSLAKEDVSSPSKAPTLSPKKGPNLVLIFLDSLRADHLGCYGYERETSPVIDSLAQKGVIVRNVISPAPGTFPSVHSILTSRPASHFFLTSRCSLPEEEMTLAEILQNHGWKTAGFSSSPLIVGRSESGLYQGGFEQGFDIFDDKNPAGQKWGWVSKTPEGIINKAINWLKDNYREQFFLFLYIMDPHDRYHSPEPYNSLYDPDYKGRKMVLKGDATHYEKRILKGKDSRLKDADIRHLEALYDGEITYADAQIGRLLEVVRKLSVAENTLFVVTSDHGEEFFEHGGLKHCYTLHRELLDIPLVLFWPHGLSSGMVIDNNLIQGIDVAPTILDLLGIPIPGTMEGISFKPQLLSSETFGRDYALSEAPYIDAKALITPDWKYIHHFETELIHPYLSSKYARGRALYNRRKDFGEENNLIEQYPEISNKMLDLMLKIIPQQECERLRKQSPLILDEPSIKKLRALGYL